jgi:hypothetical protein
VCERAGKKAHPYPCQSSILSAQSYFFGFPAYRYLPAFCLFFPSANGRLRNGPRGGMERVAENGLAWRGLAFFFSGVVIFPCFGAIFPCEGTGKGNACVYDGILQIPPFKALFFSLFLFSRYTQVLYYAVLYIVPASWSSN